MESLSINDQNRQPTSPDHDTNMAAKGEGVNIRYADKRDGTQVTHTAHEKPEGVPDKFWNPDTGEVRWQDVLKSQQELERKLGQQGQEKPEDPKPADPKPADPAPKGEEGKQQNAVEMARAEYAEKGELSAETYKALEAAGLDRATVDAYIDGQQATLAKLEAAAFEHTKDRAGFERMSAWAAQNLTKAEITALNSQLASSDPEVVGAGAKALAEKFTAANGKEPPMIQGESPNVTGGVIRSKAELVARMSDKRYGKDSAYTRDVTEAIANAHRLGYDIYG